MAFSSRSSSISSLPEPVPNRSRSRRSGPWHAESLTALKKWKRFMERLFRVDHMDFEFASWQMVNLFVAPQKVFRQSMYRKQTKNQFARDDPAFLVLLCVWFIISAVGLSLVLHLPFFSFVKFVLWILFIDCLGVGAVVATIFWFISNKYMRIGPAADDVEWGFAFDVHLNAFFPPLVILHVFQLFFYSYFISTDMFIARLFGNSLWLLSSLYYVYITFIGYTSMPTLRRTKWILYSAIPLSLVYLITIISGINVCRVIMDFYHYRVY